MPELILKKSMHLSGDVDIHGAKNSALPIIAATLLTAESVTLHNIPEIEDTSVMLNILQSFGVKATNIKKHSWKIEAKNVKASCIPAELSKKIRASILFAGPLLARCGKAEMLPPGGDVIGRRRVDTHFLALTQLGARIDVNGQFTFTANKLVGTDIFLDEASVTFKIYVTCSI